MPRKKCGLGFDCASMMLQPGIDPGDCANYSTCGAAQALTPEEEIEIVRMRERRLEERQQEMQRWQETLRVSRIQAASLMLLQRGCPQTLSTLGIRTQLSEITATLAVLDQHLATLDGQYICPSGCETHRYNVKRGSKVFWYNKLCAQSPIFAPSERKQPVRMIHLSHDDDPRNIEARSGIARRNKLSRVNSLITDARSLLSQAVAALQEMPESIPVDPTWVCSVPSQTVREPLETPAPPLLPEIPSDEALGATRSTTENWMGRAEAFLSEVEW